MSTVLRSAGLMGIATLISRILGLIREQVFAVLFGASHAMDAYNVAFRIPNLLRDLFAEGAMSTALVPTYIRTQQEEGERRAMRVAGLVFRVLFFGTFLFALLGMFFSDQLGEIYASAYKDVPGKFELMVRMIKILFPFFPFVALAAAFMGVLNAHQVFFIPALSSALFNLVSIVFGGGLAYLVARNTAFFGSSFQPIEAMAIGVVVGGMVQALFQLPSLYKAGYRFPKREPHDPVWYRDPALKKMLFLMIPATLGLAATQINILINTVLATGLGTGAVSWLNYAFRLMQFPIGVFGVSIANAFFPLITKQWVKRDSKSMVDTIQEGMRQIFALNLPASLAFVALGSPIIELIFQYGRFTVADTKATAWALSMYAVGLTAYSLVKLLVPVFYAIGNTRIPVLSSLLSVGLTIIANLYLSQKMGYAGLALGTSLAAISNFLYLYICLGLFFRRTGQPFDVMPILRSFIVYLIVSCLVAGACYWSFENYVKFLFQDAMGHETLKRFFRLFLVFSEALAIYLLLAKIFRLKEIQDLMKIFSNKIKNKLRLEPR
jgi:putative peptidoglycan lipid II flippase